MKLMFTAIAACVCALALSACGEKQQTGGGVSSDVQAYKGVDNGFAATGWNAGDKASWEQGLKARMQNTQNEYARLHTAP